MPTKPTAPASQAPITRLTLDVRSARGVEGSSVAPWCNPLCADTEPSSGTFGDFRCHVTDDVSPLGAHASCAYGMALCLHTDY